MRLPYGRKVRRRWWSFVNWTRGLKFDAVGRYRCCDHTTPFHYQWCPNRPTPTPDTDTNEENT